MKKGIVAIIILIALILNSCGLSSTSTKTQESNDAVATTPEEAISTEENNAPEGFQGTMNLITNTSANDTTTDKKMMVQAKDGKYSHKPFDLKIHLFPETAEDVRNVKVRILVEAQWCENGVPKRDFLVQSDEVTEIPVNKWYLKEIHDSLATSNYFWRITVYENDTEIILATKTVYTPFEENILYPESSIKDEAPTYHPFGDLTQEEQEFYDIIAPAIQDYGKKCHYPVLVKCEGGAQKGNIMYSSAVFAVGTATNSKQIEVFFAINSNNPKDYKADTDYKRILIDGPFDRSTSRTNMEFYLNRALTNSYNGN